jgi:hypothetical protein
MFTTGFWIRALIAVFCAIVAIIAIPLILELVGFPVSAELLLLVKLVVAVVAVIYIVKGTNIAA